MIDTPQIVVTQEQLIAFIYLTVPRAEIQKVMGPGLAELKAAIAQQGIEVAGPWFTHHVSRPTDVFDFKICIPVVTAISPVGRVEPGHLAATTVARTVYHGGYEGLAAGWGELEAWVAESGRTPRHDIWECYTAGPEANPDPAYWQTELNQPLLPVVNHEFVITRVFDAPREKVFAAWTEAAELRQWFGPKGMTVPFGEMDLRPGGSFHYCMQTPDGNRMWGKWVFREVDAPRRIVLIHSFSDPAGGITRHPFAADWPLEMLSETNFADQNGKTAVSLTWSPVNATAAEIAVFDAAHDSMQQGWTGTFDQLDAYLLSA